MNGNQLDGQILAAVREGKGLREKLTQIEALCHRTRCGVGQRIDIVTKGGAVVFSKAGWWPELTQEKQALRAFVYFIFGAGSPDVSRLVEAAYVNNCTCQHESYADWESVYIEGEDVDVAYIKLLADHYDHGYL